MRTAKWSVMQSGFRNSLASHHPILGSLPGAVGRFAVMLLVVLAGSANAPYLLRAGQVSAEGQSEGPGQNAAPLLETVLAGMDEAAAQFKSVAGDLEYTKVTVIVNDHSTETGKIYFEKDKSGKPHVMLAFQDPSEKYILFSDDKVSIYHPKIAEVDEYKVANSEGLVEQFLLLGFGTSGKELQKSYRVSVKGEETVDGEPTVHLDLIPKNRNVAARLQHVELWLSPQTWQPVQQKFFEPSKDFLVARYRNMVHNTKIAAKSFAFPFRGKVNTVRPQAGD
jgi:outer membrane lipoprotein-sorting protein